MSGDVNHLNIRSIQSVQTMSIVEAALFLELPIQAVKTLMHFGQLKHWTNPTTRKIEIEKRSILKFLA